jgi:Na+/H+ antiporter NhaD/arsenite permease-like protein
LEFNITCEKTQLRKSKPVMLGAGIIWITIAMSVPDDIVSHQQIEQAITKDLDDYASLLLFLLASMTYIGTMEEVNIFKALRAWLVKQGFSYRSIFWITGSLAFVLSPLADNLTTALVMGSVVLAVGRQQPTFMAPAMVNIVCAANAGGVFSPFGDITTLMVWQSGKLEFLQFFSLFLPALISYLIPALVMNFYLPAGVPSELEESSPMKRGARRIIALFLLTITMAVTFEQYLGLPPFMGMMIGLSLFMFHTYYLRQTREKDEPHYDVFKTIREVEWDTLLFPNYHDC